MIKLTKFTGEEFYLNPEVIKSVEEGGDTIVTLISGEKLLVREEAVVIAKSFISYKQEIFRDWDRAFRGSES
jgi:flagellar protein FlbD